MRVISQDKKYDLPYENYGFMIDGSDIRAIGIPDVIASYPCRKAAELAMEDIRITRFSNVCCLQFQKSNHFCKEGECDIYRECQKSKSPKYDVILLERPGSEGLSNEDVIRLKQFMDADKTYYPVEFYKANVDSAAMGFVATEAAEILGFDYGSDSELARFIYPILNDMEKESPDHVYEFTWKSGEDPIRIYLDR